MTLPLDPISFEMLYEFDKLLVSYYIEKDGKKSLHSIILNNFYPLDTIEIVTEEKFSEMKKLIFSAIENNSKSFFEQLNYLQ